MFLAAQGIPASQNSPAFQMFLAAHFFSAAQNYPALEMVLAAQTLFLTNCKKSRVSQLSADLS